MTERGQVEVLGYVLVFSLILLTVALVTVPGQAGLTDLREERQTANVEKGFEVLAENVDEIVRAEAPSRSTEFDLSGERFELGSPVTVEVTATPGETETFSQSRSVRPIIYRAPNGAGLVYANGAVVGEGQDGGVVMLRSPRFVVSSERTVIPLVVTELDRRQLRGRVDRVDDESRVLVRTTVIERRVLNRTDTQQDVTISVTSPRAAAWERSLAAEPGVTCTLSGNTATCTFTTDRVTVTLVRVGVALE